MPFPLMYILNTMQYLNHKMNLEIKIFTWKEFEQNVREETAHLATLNLKVYKLLPFLKGQCHEFFASGFFMNQFPPSPRVSH